LASLRNRCRDADTASWSAVRCVARITPSYRRLRVRERLSWAECDLRHTGSALWRTVQSALGTQLTRSSGIRCASYPLTSEIVFRRMTLPITTSGCGRIFRLTMIDLW